MDLAYGRIEEADLARFAEVRVLAPPRVEPVADLRAALAAALAGPLGAQRLAGRVRPEDRLAIVVSDKARRFPRTEMLEAVLAEVGERHPDRTVVVIANGQHTPTRPDEIGLDRLPFPVVSHDARDPAQLVYVGRTRSRVLRFLPRALAREAAFAARDLAAGRSAALMAPARAMLLARAALGTPVWVNREVVRADHVVCIGAVKDHYFAGWSGGAKSIVPGVAGRQTIVANHLLKVHATARLGRVDDNLLRRDLEEATALLGPKVFVLNVVADGAGRVVAAVAGDPVTAHRAAVPMATRASRVEVDGRFDCVVVAARPPLASSLYQLAKAIVPAAMAVRPGGTIVLSGACEDGTGPLLVVNHAIWGLGVRNYVPRGARIFLHSGLTGEAAARVPWVEPVASVGEGMRRSGGGRLAVIPEAGMIVPVVAP